MLIIINIQTILLPPLNNIIYFLIFNFINQIFIHFIFIFY